MARYDLTADQLREFVPALDAAGADLLRDFDAGDGCFWNNNPLVATDETEADWIAARGEPTDRVGRVLHWDETRSVPHATNHARTMTVGRHIYVLPTEFGSVAVVEAA